MQVPLLERSGTAIDCTPPFTETLVLAPGGVALCSATLELTQDNLDGGTLTSAVFARGEASDGQSVLGQNTVTQEFGQAVGLTLGGAEGISGVDICSSELGHVRVGLRSPVSQITKRSVTFFFVMVLMNKTATSVPDCRFPYEERNLHLLSQISHCSPKTASHRFLPSYFVLVEVGVFADEDGDKLGDAEETMIYTTTIANTGNVRVGGTKVSHLLAQDSAIVCDKGFEAATSLDVRAYFVPSFMVAVIVGGDIVDVGVHVHAIDPTPDLGPFSLVRKRNLHMGHSYVGRMRAYSKKNADMTKSTLMTQSMPRIYCTPSVSNEIRRHVPTTCSRVSSM